MRKVCLVNNFNYGHFLRECFRSIELQTLPFDVVVVVDDGSSDDSGDIIRSYCERLPGWVAVMKKNGGQLSCFNASLPFIEDGDLVTFLDADDLYPPDYLARLCEKARELKVDFYFANEVKFRDGKESPITSAHVASERDVVVESSSALTRRFQSWIGSPTSALAVTGRMFRMLFPFPHESDWITRADDVIVFGVGLLGGAKAYLPSLQMAYRVHGTNSFHGRQYSEGYKLRRLHKLDKLFGWYCQQQCIPLNADEKRVLREYAMIPKPLRRRLQVPSTRRFLTPSQRVALWWRLRRQARQQSLDQRQ